MSGDARQARVTAHFDAYAVDDRWGELYDARNPRSHGFLARRRKTLELLGDVRGKRVLDLGCGSGAMLGVLRGAAVEYHGIDIAPTMVAVAKRHIDQLGLGAGFRVAVGSVHALPYRSGSFDAAVGMGLLEYFDEPETVVAEALRVLKPHGTLVFTIPRRGSLDDLAVRATAPVRAGLRAITGRRGDIGRGLYRDDEFRAVFRRLGCAIVGERFYNKLPLPYPFTKLAPRLAARAAARVEDRPGFTALATGYIVACRKPG